MLFLFRSAPEVEKRIHSKLFRKFWRSRGTKEPAYITVHLSIQQIILWHPPLLAQPRPAKDAIHRDKLGEKDQADYGGAVSTWRTGRQLMMTKILIFIHDKFRESNSQLQ